MAVAARTGPSGDGGEEPGRLGRRVPRLDGDAYVTGRVRYTADHRPPGALALAVVRSREAHARLRHVEVSAALAAPGVLAAFTGADALRLTQPTLHFIDPATRGGKHVDIRCLAAERVRFVGEPVAAVVARTPAQAHAAASLVEVDCEPLPFVPDAGAALAPGAPELYPGWGTNVMYEGRVGEPDVAAAMAAADVVIEEEMTIHRYTTAPMEPRAYVAGWDACRLTMRATTQNPHQLRTILAVALGLDEEAVHVLAGALGGAFGMKMCGHPEEVLVAMAARELGATIRWVEDREECFLASGREQTHRITVGARADGRILAIDDDIVTDVGAASAQPGWAMSPLAALTLPTGYDIQQVRARLRVVVSNKPPWIASRGFGKEAATFVMERAIDLVAQRTGLDPAEVRRRNLIPADRFPYRTATGLNIDSGDYRRVLSRALDELGYDGWRARQSRERDGERPIGIGLAFELTPEASNSRGMLGRGSDTATVRVDAAGRVLVLTGVTSPGGGNETGIAQIVATELGTGLEAIEVVQGDTDRCPPGSGNFSGRSMLLGGSAAALAARAVAGELVAAAAGRLGRRAEGLVLASGAVGEPGGPPLLTLGEVVGGCDRALIEATRTYAPENTSQVPDERGRVQPYPTYSNAVMAAVVAVDTGTGAVELLDFVVAHDCGTIINPALVEGQMRGAVAMGIGAALSERLAYDEHGALTTNRFKTYLLPRALDLPRIRIVHEVTPSPFTLLGTKGAGEAGVGGATTAVANAVADALVPLGVAVTALPLTPPAVRSLIAGARSRAGENGRAA